MVLPSSKRKQDEAKSSAGDIFKIKSKSTHHQEDPSKGKSQRNFLALVTQIYELQHKLLLKYISKQNQKQTKKHQNTHTKTTIQAF